ncbi:glycosyltransferase family 87 protein [Polaribacter atrinae]|uniref:DUF2029 domain-containing protein n=1 Tax=Polaribacter atrinae TaxID=1333662 RepID=A0A176TA60_9FLAO|nr:glycosyltransferase family 87 protein [Polaribacter atrinae]OAD44747.1 hypothetical protein LPB303_11360 [Polaribacter atrinae]
MIKKQIESFKKNTFNTTKSIFLFGAFFAFAITLKEVLNLSYNNFQIFSFGSIDFWNGVNPYSNWNHLNLRGTPLDLFLYLPLFSILFTPFTIAPSWIGAFLWNFFTYTMFYTSIFNLPEKYNFKDKKFIFFISSLLLFATLLSMQFNPLIAAIFLFSYSALEKDKPFLAVFLILISGFTKVYGIFQLSMLIFYPKFWKKVLYGFAIGIVFFLLPLLKLNFNQLIPYYESWVNTISGHTRMQDFYSIYRPIYDFFPDINQIGSIISLVILLTLFVFSLFKKDLFIKNFSKRAQYLGVLMSYSILFGVGSELHTYVIAMVGYAIWYLFSKKNKLDKILLWINFFLLVIFPIDIFCPVTISKFILGKLHLGIIIFFITWLIMVYKTMMHKKNISNNEHKK